jgi:hypothetical protein
MITFAGRAAPPDFPLPRGDADRRRRHPFPLEEQSIRFPQSAAPCFALDIDRRITAPPFPLLTVENDK